MIYCQGFWEVGVEWGGGGGGNEKQNIKMKVVL
jgi:hypothetical protein